jgi:hypothetical protein
MAKLLIETYEEDKKKCTNLLDSHSARATIQQDRVNHVLFLSSCLAKIIKLLAFIIGQQSEVRECHN